MTTSTPLIHILGPNRYAELNAATNALVVAEGAEANGYHDMLAGSITRDEFVQIQAAQLTAQRAYRVLIFGEEAVRTNENNYLEFLARERKGDN